MSDGRFVLLGRKWIRIGAPRTSLSPISSSTSGVLTPVPKSADMQRKLRSIDVRMRAVVLTHVTAHVACDSR